MTAAEATSPRGQSFATHKALQQALIQAEGDEWPSQPFSSMQHNNQEPSLEIPAVDPNDYADPETHKDRSPETVERRSQHAPTKISRLTRPTSSGEDLAAGFSFGRAPPLKLDLTRKKTSDTAAPASIESHQQCRQVEKQKDHQASPPSGQTSATDAPASAPSNPPASATQDTAPLKLPGLPFPNVATTAPPKHNLAKPETPSDPHASRPIPTTPAQNEISMTADDTLVGSDIHGMNNTGTQDDLSLSLGKPADGPLVSMCAPAISTIPGRHQQDNMAKLNGKTSRLGTETHPRPKVTKTRRKMQPSVPNRGHSNSHNSPTEEDLLNVLLYKQKQAAMEREKIQEAEQAKDSELQHSIQVSKELYAQLQDMSQRYNEKETQLLKIKASKQGWESKLKRLSDYVNGLTNDHNRLRDDAEIIRERQSSVLKDKNDLFDTLRELYQATRKGNARSNQVVTEARHDLDMLEQRMQHQQLMLREEEALLVSERQRNKHLEEQISAFTSSHAQLQDSFAGHREAITGKINDLLDKTSEHIQATVLTASQDDLRPMLEQCITLLKELPKADGGVKPADFQNFEKSMREYFDGITRSVEACDHNTDMMESGHQQLALSVHNELQALGSNIVTEHALSEQIMDLREMKATVKERLHTTETALRDSRLEVVALQCKETEHLRRITILENDWRNRQPAEDPHTLFRLHESDSLNKDLRKDLATHIAQANSLEEQLQRKEEESQQLQTKCNETEALLEEARQQTASMRDEKLEFEKQAVMEREEMRSRLSEAASLELSNLKSKHMDTIQQLKAKDSPTEEKYKEAANQLTMTRKEKERIEKKAAIAKNALEAVQKERQNEIASANQLRLRIAELEKQAQEKDALYDGLHQELQDEIAGNKAKDSYMKAILAHEEKKKAERSPSVRESNLSMTLPPHVPTVVEDSQPHGYPRFASHSDIMDDQGFEPGGTPDENLFGEALLAEDLNGLFPDASKQSRTVEVRNFSYSRSTVSSREGPDTPGGQKVRSEESRQPLQQQAEPRPKVVPSANGNSNASVRRPQVNASASNPASTKSPQKPSQSQRPTQESGNAPRGILKQATQSDESRGQKRRAMDTEVPSAAGFTATKRRKSSAPTTGLGPIIADSQSPAAGAGGRGRKQAARHGSKSKKDDRFLQTFMGYTDNGHLNGSQ